MTTISNGFRTNDRLQTLSRYITVGMLGNALDFSMFSLFSSSIGFPPLAANSISYIVSGVNNFALHRRWTYAGKPLRPLWPQFSQYFLNCLICLMINNLAVLAITSLDSSITTTTGGDFYTKALAAGITALWSFFANNFWIFRSRVI